MAKNYEFGYQSRKQKLILLSLKVFVAMFIASAIDSLAFADLAVEEKYGHIGGVCIGFWAYSNLCRVKIEVQELFVPPYDNMHMFEAVIVGGIFTTIDTYLIVADIARMQGWF